MRRHLAYLSYVVRHKWFVFLAGLRVGAPLWRLIIHDWTKFLPCEWVPYARAFYKPDGSKQYEPDLAFDQAWNHHQKANKHHWQYWVILMDSGKVVQLPMPRKYLLEMVADWMGAGRAITGRWEAAEWYCKNEAKIQLNLRTRRQVEEILGVSSPPF